jgi:quercetin dioxygenase-like cupin family protein
MRVNYWIAPLYIVAAVAGAVVSWASAQVPEQIDRKIVETIPVEGTDEELQMMLVTFPPSAKSQPHTHPVEGMNYIIAGAVESKYEGEAPVHYQTGDTYLDHKGRVHETFRNTSSTSPLKFLVAYKIRKGVPFKQDVGPSSGVSSRSVHSP